MTQASTHGSKVITTQPYTLESTITITLTDNLHYKWEELELEELFIACTLHLLTQKLPIMIPGGKCAYCSVLPEGIYSMCTSLVV